MKIFALATAACFLLEATSADKLRRKAIVSGSAAGNGEAEYYTLLSTGNCAGTLIDENHVLTSAWCIEGGAPARVFVGATDRSGTTGTQRDVKCGFRHPDFTTGCNGGSDNDIAILRLNEPCSGCTAVTLSTSTNLAVGTTITEYGLGRTAAGGDYPDKIQKTTTLEVISDSDCEASWGDPLPNDGGTYFCASKANTNSGYCEGDHGGPAIVVNSGNDEQVGVMMKVDGNDNCGERPDVFTDVAKFDSWIQEVLASSDCNTDVACDGGPIGAAWESLVTRTRGFVSNLFN